jgi:putative sigma-54 modulation protein
MNIKIHGDGIKVSDGLDEYTRSRVDKLDRYLPNIADVRVELSIKNTYRGADLAIAQITVHHSRGAILRAEEKLAIENHDTIRLAVTNALEKIYRQIDRFKGKQRNKRRDYNKYQATVEELDIAEDVPAYDVGDEADIEQDIIRRKQVELMPMSEGEAIEQMELLDHGFYMFMNADTKQVNVLYRRDVGGYGILQPE